jgi:hypothetical protein
VKKLICVGGENECKKEPDVDRCGRNVRDERGRGAVLLSDGIWECVPIDTSESERATYGDQRYRYSQDLHLRFKIGDVSIPL